MSIEIIGSGSPEKSKENLIFILKGQGYRNLLNVEQYNRILESSPVKPIDDDLHRFVGVHGIEIVSYPDWFDKFYSSMAMSCVESISEEFATTVEAEFLAGDEKACTLLQSKKLIQLKKQFKALTPKLFYEGKLSNGRKILKFCKGTYEAMNPDNKDNTESQSWYKEFETKKPPNTDGLKIVITADQVTNMAMSSVFDNKSHGSCQSMWKYDGFSSHNKNLPANLLDPNSLTAYVTEGRMDDIRCYDCVTPEKHQTMLTRVMLRILKDNKGQKYIVPDRAYPHKTYTMSIMKVLKAICDESNGAVKLGIHCNWSQEHTTSKAKVSVPKIDKKISVKEASPSEYAMKATFLWGDEEDEGGKTKSGQCTYSTSNTRCAFEKKEKFQCHKCHNNKTLMPTKSYHDNMGLGEKPKPGFSYQVSTIYEIKPSWMKAEVRD